MKSPVILLTLVACLASCKKDPNSGNTGTLLPVNAKIATVVNSDGGSDSSFYRHYYLPDGRLDSMVQTTVSGYLATKTVIYQNDYVVVKELRHMAGSPQPSLYIDSFRTQGNLLPDTLYQFVSGNLYGTETFAYDANGKIQSVRSFNANGQANGNTVFTWQDGNLSSISESGLVVSLQYDYSKAAQPGEYLPWHNYRMYGLPYFQSKNLAKSFQIIGGPVIPYQYTWDSEGRIKSVFFTESGFTTYNAYTYY